MATLTGKIVTGVAIVAATIAVVIPLARPSTASAAVEYVGGGTSATTCQYFNVGCGPSWHLCYRYTWSSYYHNYLRYLSYCWY